MKMGSKQIRKGSSECYVVGLNLVSKTLVFNLCIGK